MAAQNLNLNLKVLGVQQLRAALDPVKLALYVRLENQLKEAQINLNEAIEKQYQAQGRVAEKALTDDDRRIAAIRTINAQLERQNQLLKLEETYKTHGRVAEKALTDEDRRINALRTINAQLERQNQLLALEDAYEKHGRIAEKAITDEDRRIHALRSVNAELEQQQQALANINARLDQQTLKQRVANQLKIEEGKKKQSFAETEERTKQLGVGKGLLDLFNIPTVSEKMATFGAKLSGLGELLSAKAATNKKKPVVTPPATGTTAAKPTVQDATPKVSLAKIEPTVRRPLPIKVTTPAPATTPGAPTKPAPKAAKIIKTAALPEVLPAEPGAKPTAKPVKVVKTAALPEALPAGPAPAPKPAAKVVRAAELPEALPAKPSKGKNALPAGGGAAPKPPAAAGKGGLTGALGGFFSKAGGALASAAAGPVGVAIAVGGALTKQLKQLASIPYKTIVGGMGAINNALQSLNGSLGPIGSILGAVGGIGSAMKSVGDALGPFGIGLSVMGEAIEGVSKQVAMFLETAVQLTAKARPGVVKRFQIALDDTAAVIGHRLVPVVELMTSVVRGIGDLLQTMLPSTEEFRSVLAPLGEAWEEIKDALAPVAKIIKVEMIVGLKLLGVALQHGAMMLKFFINSIPGLGLLRNLLGTDLETSVGAAARQVKFTNPESYAKEVYASAAGSGNPQQETAKNTGQMLDLLRDIRDAIREGAGAAAGGAFGSPVNDALTGARNGWLGAVGLGAVGLGGIGRGILGGF